MKVLAILVEPANYTLDLIRNVYTSRGIDFVYIKSRSDAGVDVCTSFLDGLSPLKRSLRLLKLLRQYDVFIVNGYTGATVLMFILLNLIFFRKPFALESDTELSIPSCWIRRLAKSWWLGFLFSRRSCYGFPGGGFEHRQLFLHYGMPESHVFVMPMVVDNAQYMPQVEKCRGDVFRFGYLGRLIPRKQVDKALASFCDVSTRSVEFHVIGDGEMRIPLEDRFRSDARVVFHGGVFGTKKIKLLQSLDCLILCSGREPWGLVVNEALAAGVPCIVSDQVGSRHELVEAKGLLGATGLVVPWDDQVKLTQAMCKMVEDRAFYTVCVANARARMQTWNYEYYGRQLDSFLMHLSK